MARLDEARQRIGLSDAELGVLREVNNGEQVSDGGLRDGLRAAGLIGPDGRVHDLVLDLVHAIHEPVLQGLVEVAGPQGPVHARLVVRGETLWFTDPWPGEAAEETVYHRDELTQLIFTLARLAGLRRHEVPAAAHPFTVPLGAIDAVMGAMAVDADAWESVQTHVTARFEKYFDGVPEQDATMATIAVAHLRSTHRVTLQWGPGVADCAGIAVWDCGDGGYWVRETPPEPLRREDVAPDVRATFAPVRAGEIWERYAALLPSAEQLRAVGAGGAR